MLENDENENAENLLKTAPSGEIIFTDNRCDSFHVTEGTEEQIDQDKVIVTLEDLKVEYTNVTKILPSDCYALREKDKFDLIQFKIKVKAAYNYE